MNPIQSIAEQFGANRMVLALSVARMGDAIGNSILFIVLPLYVARLPAPWMPFPDSVRTGVVLSLYGFIIAFLQPLAGALSDRVNRRKPFIQVGLIIVGAVILGFSLAGRFAHLLLLRALQGVGVASTVAGAVSLLARASEKRTRGGTMGVYTTLRMVGLAIGPLIGGFLHDHFGFSAIFVSGAAFLLVGVIMVHVWVKDLPLEDAGESARPFRLVDRQLLTPGLLGLAFSAVVMAISFTLMSTLENEFNARLNQSAMAFSVAFSALTVTRIFTQLPLGRLSDRIGRRPVIIVGLVILAISTALMGLVGSTWHLIALRLVQGLGAAAVAAPVFALAADLSSIGGEGRQMTVVTMGFGLGIAFGPLLAGLLAVVSFALPFFFGGLLSLIGAGVIYRFVPETVGGEGAAS